MAEVSETVRLRVNPECNSCFVKYFIANSCGRENDPVFPRNKRTLVYPALENELNIWILERRAKFLVVTHSHVGYGTIYVK